MTKELAKVTGAGKRKLYITEDDIVKIIDRADDFDEKLKKLGEHAKAKKFLFRIQLLMMIVKDYAQGEYDAVPWATIASIVFALMFVINPFDIIPDMLPVIGQIDDVAILALVWKASEEDLRKYARYKKLKMEQYF